MLHITQIGAVEMESGEAFSTYVLPKISIEPEAEQATGTVYDGTSVFAHGLKNAAVPIHEALSNYLKWLSTLRNWSISWPHNGRVFDFRVLSNAVIRTGLQRQFLDKVSGFTDSLSLIRSKHKKLEKYTQIFLATHFCIESYSAHDALKMLSKILSNAVSNSDLCKTAYDSEPIFCKISLILQSLCISHLWMS